eukprot:symbB.v1.2.001844.t1/scaffold77.1/size347087/15
MSDKWQRIRKWCGLPHGPIFECAWIFDHTPPLPEELCHQTGFDLVCEHEVPAAGAEAETPELRVVRRGNTITTTLRGVLPHGFSAFAMAEEILRCHCSVAVQIDGKSIHQKKFSKDFGLRAVRLVSGVVVQVLGFKHEIRLTGHNFHSASKETISAGRLLIRTKDNMMIMLTDAQPGQLQEIAKLLSGTTRPVATPGKSLKRLQAPRQAVLEIKRHKGQEASLPAASSTATVELNQVCWHLISSRCCAHAVEVSA